MLITTNYVIPELRARVVNKIVQPYFNKGNKKFEVIEGAGCPLGSRRSFFIYGNEGLPFFQEEHRKIFKDNIINYKTKKEQEKAADKIAEIIKQYPNEISIISIGIPTNIGIAIRQHKEIIPMIKEIVMMGVGSIISYKDNNNINEFSIQNQLKIKCNISKNINYEDLIKKGFIIQMYPNHNISGDILATKYIFNSSIPIKIIDHGVTSKFWLEGDSINYLRKKAQLCKDKINPENSDEAVGLLMDEWFRRRRQNGQCPHDPLAVHECIFGGEESVINYIRGILVVHESSSFCSFVPNPNGRHLFGFSTKNEKLFLEKLTNAIINNIY